jgi:site-specific DNA-methyltransferase (adenine-specific)/modification methylase
VLAGQYGMDYEVDVRVASRPLTEKEREKLTVYLHEGAAGTWDFEALAEWEYTDLVSWGFDSDTLDEMFAALEPEPGQNAGADTEAQMGKAEELREKWNVSTGQMWALGEHRLICGDCTDAATVARLMGGEKSQMMFTDPPYGVERDKGFGGSVGFGGQGVPIARRQYADDWDSSRPEKATFDILLEVAPKSIIFGGNFFADILPRSTHWIVWDKLNTMPTFGDCELAWTNIDRHSVKKYTVQYNGLIGKEKERFHPTQKPVAIMSAILEDYTSNADLIFEPFSGSGTTIIACQNLNRKCRAIEISLGYVAVALQRFFDHTGIQPVLLA